MALILASDPYSPTIIPILALLVFTLAITAFPQVALFLPNLFAGR